MAALLGATLQGLMEIQEKKMITMNNSFDQVQNERTDEDLKTCTETRYEFQTGSSAAANWIPVLSDAKSIFDGLALLNEKNAYVHGILGSLLWPGLQMVQ